MVLRYLMTVTYLTTVMYLTQENDINHIRLNKQHLFPYIYISLASKGQKINVRNVLDGNLDGNFRQVITLPHSG